MPQLIVSIDGTEFVRVSLEKERTTLGRRPYNDIVLNYLVISGEHCVFVKDADQRIYVEDLGSTNGTLVNGAAIHQRHPLSSQDLVQIGHFEIRYVDRARTATEATSAVRQTDVMSLQDIGLSGTNGKLRASLKMLAGASMGLEIPLVKAVTTFGQPSVGVVSISHRRDGYYVTHVEGIKMANLNGQPLGNASVALNHHDVLDLADTAMEFLLQPR